MWAASHVACGASSNLLQFMKFNHPTHSRLQLAIQRHRSLLPLLHVTQISRMEVPWQESVLRVSRSQVLYALGQPVEGPAMQAGRPAIITAIITHDASRSFPSLYGCNDLSAWHDSQHCISVFVKMCTRTREAPPASTDLHCTLNTSRRIDSPKSVAMKA